MKILRSLCFRLLLPAACVLSGCSAAEWVGMKLMFSPAPVEESQVLRDIPYVKEEAHLEKHRLVNDKVPERTITILGPWESEPEKDILSNESEFAKKLLGTKTGAYVEVGGATWRVASVEPWE